MSFCVRYKIENLQQNESIQLISTVFRQLETYNQLQWLATNCCLMVFGTTRKKFGILLTVHKCCLKQFHIPSQIAKLLGFLLQIWAGLNVCLELGCWCRCKLHGAAAKCRCRVSLQSAIAKCRRSKCGVRLEVVWWCRFGVRLV